MKKEKEEEKEPLLGEQLEFNHLFRIKGKKGLFAPNSTVNKAGMINMVSFLDRRIKHTVKAKDLVCLGNLWFSDNKSDMIPISEVFVNWETYLKGGGKPSSDHELMNALLPNYDPEKFKMHHAVQVVKWFDCAISKINAVLDEGEKAIKQMDVKGKETKEELRRI